MLSLETSPEVGIAVKLLFTSTPIKILESTTSGNGSDLKFIGGFETSILSVTILPVTSKVPRTFKFFAGSSLDSALGLLIGAPYLGFIKYFY